MLIIIKIFHIIWVYTEWMPGRQRDTQTHYLCWLDSVHYRQQEEQLAGRDWHMVSSLWQLKVALTGRRVKCALVVQDNHYHHHQQHSGRKEEDQLTFFSSTTVHTFNQNSSYHFNINQRQKQNRNNNAYALWQW